MNNPISFNLGVVRSLFAQTNDMPEVTRKQIIAGALNSFENLIKEVELLERKANIQKTLNEIGSFEDDNVLIH